MYAAADQVAKARQQGPRVRRVAQPRHHASLVLFGALGHPGSLLVVLLRLLANQVELQQRGAQERLHLLRLRARCRAGAVEAGQLALRGRGRRLLVDLVHAGRPGSPPRAASPPQAASSSRAAAEARRTERVPGMEYCMSRPRCAGAWRWSAGAGPRRGKECPPSRAEGRRKGCIASRALSSVSVDDGNRLAHIALRLGRRVDASHAPDGFRGTPGGSATSLRRTSHRVRGCPSPGPSPLVPRGEGRIRSRSEGVRGTAGYYGIALRADPHPRPLSRKLRGRGVTRGPDAERRDG